MLGNKSDSNQVWWELSLIQVSDKSYKGGIVGTAITTEAKKVSTVWSDFSVTARPDCLCTWLPHLLLTPGLNHLCTTGKKGFIHMVTKI